MLDHSYRSGTLILYVVSTVSQQQSNCSVLGSRTLATPGFSLHDLHDLENKQLSTSDGPPGSYNRFLRLVQGASVALPLMAPAKLPPVPCASDMQQYRLQPLPASAAVLRDPDEQESPSAEEGLPPRSLLGGEVAAHDHLKVVCQDTKFVATFSKPDTNPLSVSASTTLLSAYLAHGCLSPRTMHQSIQATLAQFQGKQTKPPQSLLGQLLWRDHFHLEAHMTGIAFFSQDHPRCLSIGWHAEPGERLRAWEEGMTGVPLVDAGMRQLAATGWLHHILRHVVACFLTRGALWVSWEHGMRVFARHLLDHDPAINAANWQWLAGSHFYVDTAYSPLAFR